MMYEGEIVYSLTGRRGPAIAVEISLPEAE